LSATLSTGVMFLAERQSSGLLLLMEVITPTHKSIMQMSGLPKLAKLESGWAPTRIRGRHLL